MTARIGDHHNGPFDDRRKGVVAAIVVSILLTAGGLNVAHAQDRTGATETLFTREELHLRAAHRLRDIEALRDGRLDYPSSHELCRARSHQVGSDSFARCWIAAEEAARTRAVAIAKLGALARFARALASLPTSSEIKPAVVGATGFKTTLCYDRKVRRIGSCYDI